MPYINVTGIWHLAYAPFSNF
jgi:hypothetical protein